ncbi:MAG: hypothetical protein K8L97_10450 [Anaerolineae bacterium]|nr:hypothetical protein [Anaerolineae bacterium]
MFGTPFVLFSGALVFHDVGNDFMIEACPASSFSVKSGIGVEVTAGLFKFAVRVGSGII